MQNSTMYRLTHQAWLIGLISAAFSTASFAAAGKIEFSVGNVIALNTTGNSRSLTKGTEINAGDTIQTQDGRAQLRFSDGGYISLQPNTEFKVEDYSFNGKADGSEKGFFNLVRGGLRAITGAIGHGNNKSAYRVNTPVATIGIRGTEYLAQFDTKLLVKVGDGAVYLQNSGGDLTLFKGQSGEVGGDGSKPQHSDDTPSVGAAGPNGGKPSQTTEGQQESQKSTFSVAELRTEDGAICTADSGGGGCTFVNNDASTFDMAGQIQALGGTTAYYSGSSSLSGGYSVDTQLYINFGPNTVDLYDITISSGSSGSINAYSLSPASLDTSTGGFAFSAMALSQSSSGSLSGNSFTGVSGSLDKINGLPSATVNFNTTLSGGGSSGSVQVVKSSGGG